jgi:hypothetical protein
VTQPFAVYRPQVKPGQEREKPRKHLSRSSSLRGKPVTSDEADEFLAATYYPHVKAQPCCVCGDSREVHAHHFSGMANPKSPSKTLKRSHVGVAKYATLPLCPLCHMNAHSGKGERAWLEAMVPNAVALSHRLLAEAALIAVARSLSLAQALEEAA